MKTTGFNEVRHDFLEVYIDNIPSLFILMLDALVPLLSLIALEVILGIDNIISFRQINSLNINAASSVSETSGWPWSCGFAFWQ